MSFWYRFRTVAVANALVAFMLLFVQIGFPLNKPLDDYLGSPSFKLILSIAAWFAAPLAYRWMVQKVEVRTHG
jgi:hypothetical protein